MFLVHKVPSLSEGFIHHSQQPLVPVPTGHLDCVLNVRSKRLRLTNDHSASVAEKHEIVLLVYQCLTRFARTFNCTLGQLRYIVNNEELMGEMVQKFSEAVSLLDKTCQRGPDYDDELHQFLDKVLICVLEGFVDAEMLVSTVPFSPKDELLLPQVEVSPAPGVAPTAAVTEEADDRTPSPESTQSEPTPVRSPMHSNDILQHDHVDRLPLGPRIAEQQVSVDWSAPSHPSYAVAVAAAVSATSSFYDQYFAEQEQEENEDKIFFQLLADLAHDQP